MEFWNNLLTEKSWEVLKEIRKKYHFILIGGWATYLWAKQQKSRDIDIVVDVKELQKLKEENLSKNDNLKKYEIKRGEIDIDIYVDYYSKLAIPAEDIKNYYSEVEGFNVIIPELLLILKQGALIDRENSAKGEKDKIDIISIILFSNVDYKKYYSILKKYHLENYLARLLHLLRNFKDFGRFNLTPKEFKVKKEKVVGILKSIK
ncbi:MAG: hypothetical protein AABX07_00045 [Nanoarchaeota archaeon]